MNIENENPTGWMISWPAGTPGSLNQTGFIPSTLQFGKQLAEARARQGAIVTPLFPEPKAAVQITNTLALKFAFDAMTRLHESATPDDGPEVNAIIPAAVFRLFVDEMAKINWLIHAAKQPEIAKYDQLVADLRESGLDACEGVPNFVLKMQLDSANAIESLKANQDFCEMFRRDVIDVFDSLLRLTT